MIRQRVIKTLVQVAFTFFVFSLFCDLAIADPAVQRTHHTGDQPEPPNQHQVSVPDTGQPSDDPDNELAELSLEELMDVQVVVTAGRHEQKINAVPYAISVITADDIRASGARSIGDALRLVPGIDVADLSSSNAAISPRGFHGFIANQVLVLVDGRQIFDSLFGGTLWGSWPFQLEDIARIEVIRGPGGVTWGANAVNGVINIITKDPTDQLGLTLTTSGGSQGTFKQHWSRGILDGKLRLRISGEYEASDGFEKGGSVLRRLDDEFKTGRLGLHAIYEKDDDNTYTFSAGSAIVDGGFPPTPLAGIGQRRNSESQASFLLGKWHHRVAQDNHFDITGYINDFQVSPGIPSIDYRYQQIGLLFSNTYKLDETHSRTWGIDTRTDLFEGGNSDPFLLTKSFVGTAIVGAYLQDEWRLTPKWTLNLGGRIDYEFYGGFQPSGRASLSYTFEDGTFLYGSVSRAFQMPPAAARFLDIPLLNGLSHVTANRGVNPKTLVAYELGYRGKLFGLIDTDANLFWHQYDELTTLGKQLGPPGLIRIDFDNRSGQASLYGLELDAKYTLSRKLTLLGNYTYEQLNWDVSGQYGENDFVSPPKHKVMIGTRYTPDDAWRLSANLFYVDAVRAPNPSNPFGSRRIDPYFRLDVNTEYELRKDQASIAVGVKNLTDRNHYEGGTLFINDAQVPRTFFAEFRLQIK